MERNQRPSKQTPYARPGVSPSNSKVSSTHSGVQSSGSTQLPNYNFVENPKTGEKWLTRVKNWFASPPIPQNSFVDVEESDDPREIIYREAVAHNSRKPHVVNFQHPTKIICGIACIPKDENTSSPEIDVLGGGVGFNYVDIRLTPAKEGYWACGIEIMGRERKQYEEKLSKI